MTPVEATSTLSVLTPSAFAAASQHLSAFSSPIGAQAFALPLFARIALARPSLRCSLVICSGAAFTAFFVYTAAAAQSVSE